MSRNEQSDQLLARLKQYALMVIRLYSDLPHNRVAEVIGGQLLRSGTSPGSHYSEARRAKSAADFISKIEGGLQELEESAYWLDLLDLAEVLPHERLADLIVETDELIRIFVTIARNARDHRRR